MVSNTPKKKLRFEKHAFIYLRAERWIPSPIYLRLERRLRFGCRILNFLEFPFEILTAYF